MFRALRPVSSVRQALVVRGTDGSIKSAGGTWAKREHAQEEQYFRKKTAQELEDLKKDIKEHPEKHPNVAKEQEKKH